ncbi:phage tail assembly protein [Chromobacterium violaceum]
MSTKTIPLKHGLTVGQNTYKSLTLRAPKLGDLIDAEQDAPASNLFAFRAALIAQVAVSADDFTGPFSLGMLRDLEPEDFNLLTDGLNALQKAGE